MFATLNDAEIFFDVSGSHLGVKGHMVVERPTIIAIHGGLGFDHGYLKPAFDMFRDEAQVIFVDLRGQGRSSRPPLETCTLEQMSDDIAALCGLLGIANPTLFGHSAGGFVALHTTLRHPGLVGGLILCDSSPTVAPIDDDDGHPTPTLASRATPEALSVAERIFSGEITQEMVSLFLTTVAPYYAAPAHMARVSDLLALCTPDITMMRHFMQRIAPLYDLRSDVEAIEAPTLVLVGAHDWVCPPRASRLLARSIPAATLVEFEESGHFPFLEEPQKFRDAVSEFLHRDPAATASV